MSAAALATQYTEILLETARQSGLDCNALFGDEPVFATRGRKPKWNNYHLGVMQMNLKHTMQDEFWGMLGDAHVPLGTFRFACELCTLSANLEEALTRAYRLYGLVSDGVRFRLDIDGGEQDPVDPMFLKDREGALLLARISLLVPRSMP